MDRHPAIRRIKAECYRLNLHQYTAKELARFLIVKRVVDGGSSEASRGAINPAVLAPSVVLERLLYKMLMETDVREVVEVLVGKVQHKPHALETSEDVKIQRRLKAMDAMHREGWAPTLDLWRELLPGRAMDKILTVSVEFCNTARFNFTRYFCGNAQHSDIIDKLASEGFSVSER